VWAKVEEEIGELQENITNNAPQADIEEEFGDVLFSMVNYARFIGVDPETALERVNRKFKQRFEFIESNAPKPLKDMQLSEMEALWQAAKKVEKS
jgi:XTP/dITP diphosphohydrolase